MKKQKIEKIEWEFPEYEHDDSVEWYMKRILVSINNNIVLLGELIEKQIIKQKNEKNKSF